MNGNNMCDKLVSIIVPAYNSGEYLDRFFKNVLLQTYKSFELIIVNDGSDDNTETIVLSYKERFINNGIKLIYLLQEHSGAAKAINSALPLVHGEFMMWVDADDIILPNNLLNKVNYLKKHSELDFVLCRAVNVDQNNIGQLLSIEGRKKRWFFDPLFRDIIVGKNVVYGPGTILVRTKSLIKVIPKTGIFETSQGQNYQLILPLAAACRWGYIKNIDLKIVCHQDSHSRINRNYDQLMERHNDFEKIICNTIESIPNLNDKEKEKWKRFVWIYRNKEKLRCAFFYEDYKRAEKIQNDLRSEKVILGLGDYYRTWKWYVKIKMVIYYSKSFFQKLKFKSEINRWLDEN